MSGETFAETEALIEVMVGATEDARWRLRQMTVTELRELKEHAGDLALLCGDVLDEFDFVRCKHGNRISTCYHFPRCSVVTGRGFGRWVLQEPPETPDADGGEPGTH